MCVKLKWYAYTKLSKGFVSLRLRRSNLLNISLCMYQYEFLSLLYHHLAWAHRGFEGINSRHAMHLYLSAATCLSLSNALIQDNTGHLGYVHASLTLTLPSPSAGVSGSLDSYCSLKPLCSGMGEVVPARTSPTLLPPSPRTVLSLSCFKVSQCINCRY